MQEIWKPIPNYEGYYEVSNLGNVRSVERKIISRYGILITLKSKPRKKQVTRDGYELLVLNRDGKYFAITVHRLVMYAFIGYQDKQVNHINGIKTDNTLENLEYCTCRQNVIHFWRDKKTTSQYTGVCFDKNRGKWVASITINGKQKTLGRYATESGALQARKNIELSVL